MRQKYTETQLANAVQSSTSIRQVLAKLELVEAGGNYSTVQRRIRVLGLDTSHFTRQGWRKGTQVPVVPAKSLTELLRQGTRFQSHKLKNRLLAAGLKRKQCEPCRNTEWLGEPLPLELHHLNGDTTDNRIENLRLFCPNCHALTENYRGRKLAKCRDETAPS